MKGCALALLSLFIYGVLRWDRRLVTAQVQEAKSIVNDAKPRLSNISDFGASLATLDLKPI